MPVSVNGKNYYRTAEVYRLIGISRNTLYRWLDHGVLGESELRDRRGWRLFTECDIEMLKSETERITLINRSRK